MSRLVNRLPLRVVNALHRVCGVRFVVEDGRIR